MSVPNLDQAGIVHCAQVAGLFYPAEPQALRALIGEAASRAGPDGGVKAKVVIAPHAGIVYSGAVAATAFGPWLRGPTPPKRIVIVGPAHRYAFRGLALHPASHWRTPLGDTPVATDLVSRLVAAGAARVDPRPFAGEHSLEMHLVMLQAMLGAPFEIVPLLVGDAAHEDVAEALRVVWGGPETVISISSDLSHFLDDASARSIDADTARRIETLDASAMEARRASGFLPIGGALDLAEERDLRITALQLANSADAGADRARVVGYGAFALEYAASARLADADREILLASVRDAVSLAAEGNGARRLPRARPQESPALAAARATFVTLTEDGALRGCLGSPTPRRPLVEDAATNAVQAGFADPRFPPLRGAELERLRIEVSILSHPRPTPASSEAELVAALEPDRDGLIVSSGHKRALFLPSVWRQLPDPHAFVRHLFAKAGFEARGWPNGIEARRFRTESFGAEWPEIAQSP